MPIKRFRSLFVPLFTVTLWFNLSCGEAEKEPAEPGANRMEVVLAVHDSVMPKMRDISKLVAELKPLADSTGSGSTYSKAMADLQAAHQSMMDWMRGFGDRFDHEEVMKGKELSPEKQEWLKEEEVKVRAMQEQVLASIANARAVLAGGED